MVLISAHAASRCLEMTIDPAEVLTVITNPEITYPSPRSYGPGRVISVGGRLAVVHCDTSVITVLWRGLDHR
jgi:hypothetical protein